MSEVLLAGESGSYTITHADLTRVGAKDMREFEAVIVDEAKRRGLAMTVREDLRDGSLVVHWWTL